MSQESKSPGAVHTPSAAIACSPGPLGISLPAVHALQRMTDDANHTGLPDNLKAGIESISRFSLADVTGAKAMQMKTINNPEHAERFNAPPVQLAIGNSNKVVQMVLSRSDVIAEPWKDDKKKIHYGGINTEVVKTEALSIYMNGSPNLPDKVYRAVHTPIIDLAGKIKTHDDFNQQLLAKLPSEFKAPKPGSGSLVFSHIGKSDGQYLSTSKDSARAAKYATRSWNQATVDVGRVKQIVKWSPIVEIDVAKAKAKSSPIYDMTDPTTLAAILALEITEPDQSGAILGVMANAALDKEVTMSNEIAKESISGVQGNADEITRIGYGPNAAPVWILNCDDAYFTIKTGNLKYTNDIIQVGNRPSWSPVLLKLRSDRTEFVAGRRASPQQANEYFGEHIDVQLSTIYEKLTDEKNPDRGMTLIEWEALQVLIQAMENYYRPDNTSQ